MNYTEAVMNSVQIDKKRYEELLDDSCLLGALLACGVDNWSGYDSALDMYEDRKGET